MSTYREVTLAHYMSRAEAAEYLGITTKTVDRYIAAGKLEAIRVGPRLIRIPLASVEALLAAGTDQAGA